MLFVADAIKIIASLWGCWHSYKLLQSSQYSMEKGNALLKFWSLLAILTIYENTLEPLVSWFPMYSFGKAGLMFFVLSPNSNVLETSAVMFSRVVTPLMTLLHSHTSRTLLPLGAVLLMKAVTLSQSLYVRAFADSLSPEEMQRWTDLIQARTAQVNRAVEAAESRRKAGLSVAGSGHGEGSESKE